MTNHTREISEFILNGSTITDAARIFGLSDTRTRQILHRFCRDANEKIYESLMSGLPSVHVPRLLDLQLNKDKFLEDAE